MEAHYTYIGHLIHDQNWQKFISAVVLAIGVIFFARKLPRLFSSKEERQKAVVPPAKMNAPAFFDFFVEAFVSYHDSILGKENRKYASFSGSIFLFILLSNLIGLIPGMAAITTTVWINVGIALLVFGYFNFHGVKEHGLKGYLAHFCGPLLVLAPLIFSIEMISLCLRVLTLNLRLYWNITADHKVLEIFTDVGASMGLPIIAAPVYILGIFVSFMQAFIFTTLTMVYILLAVQHEEH